MILFSGSVNRKSLLKEIQSFGCSNLNVFANIDVLDIFSFPKELVMKHLKTKYETEELTYNCTEEFHENLVRLVTPFKNLKIWKSVILRCVRSLCSKMVSLNLKMPCRFSVNERMNKRPCICIICTKYITRWFAIFSPHDITLIAFLWFRNVLYMFFFLF